MVGQGHFASQSNFFVMIYLPFINGGTTFNKISLLTSVTVCIHCCIESCGTNDISSTIISALHFTQFHSILVGISDEKSSECQM